MEMELLDAICRREQAELRRIGDTLAGRVYVDKPRRFVRRLERLWATRGP
ncbi:MAG: hypothetical protein R2695_14930 [Acidimicrobiales bacterium]